MQNRSNVTHALEQLTQKLAVMARWRQSLAIKIDIAELRVELGLPDPTFDDLQIEIADFSRIAGALAEQMPGSLVNVNHDERDAA
jgi:hypothetical protein